MLKECFSFHLFYKLFFPLMLAKNLLRKQCWVLDQHCILIRKKKNPSYYSLWKTTGPLEVCECQCLIFLKTQCSDQHFASLGLIVFHSEMSSFESHFWQDGVLLHSLGINRGWQRREMAPLIYEAVNQKMKSHNERQESVYLGLKICNLGSTDSHSNQKSVLPVGWKQGVFMKRRKGATTCFG